MSPVSLRFIPPQLATSVDEPPEGKNWIYGLKHDGYRRQVVLERGYVRMFTPNGHDWTECCRSVGALAHCDGPTSYSWQG